jgi:hypothetical protein
MPWEEQKKSRTGVAGANLSASQYFAVTLNSSGLMVVSTAGANTDGILQDNPLQGKAGSYGYDGTMPAAISASNTLAIGSLLEVDTGGTLKLHASGTVVAKSLEALASNAAVCLVAVALLRSNASF